MNTQQHKGSRSWNTNRLETKCFGTKSMTNTNQTNNTTKGDTTMKNTKMFTRFGVAMVVALLISSVQVSFAAGTAAGTAITNTASVTFNDGVNVKNKTSNTVTMYVGHKVAGSYSPASGSTNTYDNVTYYHPIEFTNGSNRGTPYTVSFNSVTGYTLSLVADDNEDGIHQSGETTAVTSDSIGVDAAKKYFIKAVVGTVANGTADNIVVTFTSAAVNNAGANVVVINPAAAFTYTLTSTIVKPVLAYTVDGTAPSPLIPGAQFNFTVTLDNSGTATPYGVNQTNDNATGDSVQLQYTVPTNFQFNGGSSGTFALSPSGSASFLYSAGVITIMIDTTLLDPADAAVSFTLPIIIDQTQNNGTGPASGQPITSQLSDFGNLSYYNPQTSLTTAATAGGGTIFTGATTVATSKGGKWTVRPDNDSTAVNETNEYILTLKNMGNTTASFTISDIDSAGNVIVDHIISESSNGSDLAAGNTASVVAGSTIQIYVRVTVPGTAAVNDSIKRMIEVSSNATGTLWTGATAADYRHTITTIVVAATFNISLSAEAIEGVGTTSNPAPGDTITFALTIANTGTTNVTSVVISNLVPTNMTFLPNSYAAGFGIRIDAVNQSNANDGDSAYYDGSAVKTNSSFSVNAGVTKTLRYKCQVN